MKVHSSIPGRKSKKHLLTLSCATVLASFALIARPAFAAEQPSNDLPNDGGDTITAGTENVQTTADLVETTTTSTSTTENSASSATSEQTQSESTQSVVNSGNDSNITTPDHTETTNRTEVTSGTDAFRSVTDTAQNTSGNTVSGGQYYSDDLGNWYYKDTSGKNVTGEQTIDGVKVYFDDYGIQVKDGFSRDGRYYDKDSGALVTDRYINHLGGVYYIDQTGVPLKGAQTVNGNQVYFNDYSGLKVRGDFASNGHYYNSDGHLVTNAYVFSNKLSYNKQLFRYYLDENGNKVKGEQTIDGKAVYFDPYDGHQIQNDFANDGRFYDQDGNLADLGTNRYVFINGAWYYVGKDGKILKGAQTIDGVKVYFNPYFGSQVKGGFNSSGQYYDKDSGELITNRYIQLTTYKSNATQPSTLETNWYYLGADGRVVTGPQTIDGSHVYFNTKGQQIKGQFGGDGYFYDENNGELVTSRFVTVNNATTTDTYYLDDKGKRVTGEQVIDGKQLNFGQFGSQVKGNFAPNGRFHDASTGDLVTNRYVQIQDQSNSYNTLRNKDKWFYVGPDGKAVKGEQTIDGVDVFFDQDGVQAKGIFTNGGYYYDKETGARKVLGQNQFAQVDGYWYYVDSQGKIVTGEQTIDGRHLYFDKDGKQVKGAFAPNGAFYDENSGERVSNRYIFVNDAWYRIGADGTPLKGAQIVDGQSVYFDKDGKQVKGQFADDGYYYDKDSGALVNLGQNQFVQVDGYWYYLDHQGKIVKGEQTIDENQLYFDTDGKQIKGAFAPNNRFYAKDTGSLLKNQFVDVDGNTYYVDANGQKFTQGGTHTINGKEYTFIQYGDGHLARGEFDYPYGSRKFYDLDNKEVKGPKFVTTRSGGQFYLSASGQAPTGLKIINGDLYYFGLPTNKYAVGAVSGQGLTKDYYPNLIPNGSNIYYFDTETAKAIKNQYKEIDGSWYYFGPYWYALTGPQTIDGVNVYFHQDGKQAKGELVSYQGDNYYYDEHSGTLVTNQTRTINGQTYHFDANGRASKVD